MKENLPGSGLLGKTVALIPGEKRPNGVFSAALADDKTPAYLFGQETENAAVIGIFRRRDGTAALLCVPEALKGTPVCYECNLRHALRSSEDAEYGKIYPLYEKTSGAVLYTERNSERLYLLVKSKSGHIGFPKGHTEYGETELENARREIFEETGLPFSPHPAFRAEYTYTTLENTQKTGVFFLSRFEDRLLSFQKEEVFADWLVPYEKAMELLNFPEDREVLRAAETLLNTEGSETT